MNYHEANDSGFLSRWNALALRWKIAIGAVGVFFLASALGEDSSYAIPPGVSAGVELSGLQLAGEKPLYHDEGIHVTDTHGPWIEVRFGEDDASRRWFHMEHVAGLKVKFDK